jgi:hypothetical protein
VLAGQHGQRPAFTPPKRWKPTRRQLERRILGEDELLELAQPCARLQTELIQRRPRIRWAASAPACRPDL